MKKPQNHIDPKYLEHIRKHPCVVPGCLNKTDAHHLKTVGSGRNDYTAIPLCRTHHTEIHYSGNESFNDKYSIDVWREAFESYFRWVNNESYSSPQD